MRFQRLQIPAFGPFTNLDLQFRDQPRDFHVISGPNEAGKSSLLRAIRDLLFGIHGQSADNFLHDFAALRIRGEIRNRAGERLLFQRRKGNKNTLLDADGRQLPETALLPFLGSVDQSYFSAMFGLGTRELSAGAQQLLRGEGEIGTALFSASLGGTPVQKVVAALQAEADLLYKGRATANVSLRPAATRYKELVRQSREAMVNPETWDKIEQELTKAGTEKKQLEDEITQLQLDLAWVGRCEDALPTVGRLVEAMQKLAQLPPLPDLASDFVTRAQAARKAVGEAQAEVQRLNNQIGNLKTQLQACQTMPGVLAEADTIDLLHQDLGAYRERKKSVTVSQARLAGLEPLIRAGMNNLQLTGEFASLESRRLNTAAKLACEETAEALREALQDQRKNADETKSHANQISAKEAELQLLPETNLDEVRDALAVAAVATDADRTIAATETEVQRLTRETTDQHRLVTDAPADFNATARLVIPAIATIRHFQKQMEEIKRKIDDEEKTVEANRKRGEDFQAELTRMQRQGELPTEEALRKTRELRDRGWQLVLAEWKGDGAKEELVPNQPLEEAFPQLIKKADEIADKLRLQAEAVAQVEEKRFQLGEIEKKVGDAGQKIQKLQTTLSECNRAWQTEWATSGITSRSPVEMEEWHGQWSEFRNRLGKQLTAEELSQKKRDQVMQAKLRLASVLAKPEEKEFSLLYAAAVKLVRDGEQASGKRIEKAEQLGVLKGEMAKLEQSRTRLDGLVTTATKKWKEQCANVGLPENTSPDAGLTLLQERKELLVKFDEWQKLSNESRTTAQAITQYDKDLGAKAEALSIKGDTTEAQESALWKALTAARQTQTRHDQLAEQIQQASNELEDAKGQASQSGQNLNDLILLAGLQAQEELEPLLANLEQRSSVQAQIDGFRNTLGGFARGQNVDEFISKVRAENPDALAERKSSAERNKQEKESILTTLRETLFRLGNEKKNLEMAGDAAAGFRQQAESFAATLRRDASRFMRLRLATSLLQSQIERFRKENQGPLLQKSGEFFKSITRGAFSGLSADFNADDLPVLVGVRPDDARVPVEGLSEGSRDQLYLALRLAALDRYLEEHEPMPLILDDLLITFDNERAKAILPLLCELSKRTQIFLFTHHDHLVALCRETLGEEQFQLHCLSTDSPTA